MVLERVDLPEPEMPEVIITRRSLRDWDCVIAVISGLGNGYAIVIIVVVVFVYVFEKEFKEDGFY